MGARRAGKARRGVYPLWRQGGGGQRRWGEATKDWAIGIGKDLVRCSHITIDIIIQCRSGGPGQAKGPLDLVRGR